MKKLQREFGLSYIFIAHDLSVVQYMSDHIAVMYLGKIVEIGEAGALYQNSLHPYTRALLSAVPTPVYGQKKQRVVLGGDVGRGERRVFDDLEDVAVVGDHA